MEKKNKKNTSKKESKFLDLKNIVRREFEKENIWEIH